MKVIFAPFDLNNHYHKVLSEYLKKENMSVVGLEKAYLFPFFISFLKNKNVKILNLHWISIYLIGRNLVFCWLKFLLFLMDLFLIKILNKKVIWTAHNLYNHEKIYYRLEIIFIRFLVNFFDAIIVHSEKQKEKIISFYSIDSSRVFVIREGSYEDLYPVLDKEKSKKEIELSDKRIFLFFGNIREYKGTEILIKAFKLTTNQNNILIIAGKPYDNLMKNKIKQLISNDKRIISYLYRINDKFLSLLFSASDCVILPYTDIFNSSVSVMVLYMGKCAIYSDIDVLDDILNGCGISFNVGNILELKNIIESITDKEILKYSRNSLIKAKKHRWDTYTLELKKLYEEIISR